MEVGGQRSVDGLDAASLAEIAARGVRRDVRSSLEHVAEGRVRAGGPVGRALVVREGQHGAARAPLHLGFGLRNVRGAGPGAWIDDAPVRLLEGAVVGGSPGPGFGGNRADIDATEVAD